jgi:hypothetical protein
LLAAAAPLAASQQSPLAGRAVAVLEQIGTPAAQSALRDIANGDTRKNKRANE